MLRIKSSARLWIFISAFPLVLVGCSESPTLSTSLTSPTSVTNRGPEDMAPVISLEIVPERARLRIGEIESFSVFVVFDW